MIEVMSGAGVGAATGFAVGLIVALYSRDGVWPEVWAWLVMLGAAIGAFVGVLAWGVKWL